MRLLLVELTRLRARRAIVLLLVGTALLAAVIVGTGVYDTRPVSAADLAQAQAQVDRESQRPRVQRDYQRCLENPEQFMGPQATTEDCEQMMPQLEWFLFREPLDLGRQLGERGLAVLLLLGGVGMVVGATFAGADWATGSMSNQLLFEPRRLKVWLAKAAALVLGFSLFACLIIGAFWAVLAVTAQARDITTAPQVVRDIWQTSARGVVLAAGASLGSFALTMMFRHTVGTLALLLGYAVAGEPLFRALPIEQVSQWTPSANLQAFVEKGARIYDDSICGDFSNESCDPQYFLAFGHAAWYLGLLLVVVIVLSMLLFRRRDIP